DLLLQQHYRIDQLLRPRWAARDKDVDRNHLVDRNESVVVEHARRGGAGAHGDYPLRLRHLLVKTADHRPHLVTDAPADDHEVGLPRRAPEHFRAEAGDIEARRRHRHHLDGATSEAERHGPDRILARPVDGRAQGCSDNSLRYRCFESLVIDAVEQLLRAAGHGFLIHIFYLSYFSFSHEQSPDTLLNWLRKVNTPQRSNRPPRFGESSRSTGISGDDATSRPRRPSGRFWAPWVCRPEEPRSLSRRLKLAWG